MWKIKKSFQFEYGHRVWTQSLQKDFSCDTELKCRFLHGHHGVVEVTLSSNTLDSAGMVTDFKHLNWFKQFLDTVLDHKMIIDIKDPVLPILFPLILHKNLIRKIEGYSIFPLFSDPLLREIYEGVVIVEFVPTAENLSCWLQGIIEEKMKKISSDICVEVTFFETPSSSSHFSKI